MRKLAFVLVALLVALSSHAARCADVKSGVVTNIVQWDGVTPYTPPDGGTLVASTTAQLCWTYSGGSFTSAACPAPTPAPNTGIGIPNPRTFAMATAYQATDPTRPANVIINLNSSATLSLLVGVTNVASVWIGPTTAVASGTGYNVGNFTSSLTGTLVVGLGVTTTTAHTITIALPAGYYFAILNTTGTVNAATGYDQSLGS